MTIKNINICRIKFPEIQLQARDAHKLRGYFGTTFKEHSPLLHNHWESGNVRYRYPNVQYKVINEVPTLIGVEEGAELLAQLFFKIKEIDINGQKLPIQSKNIEVEDEKIGFSQNLEEYSFKTLWMALNQRNYSTYQKLDEAEKQDMMNRILVGHILSFFKNMGVVLKQNERLLARVNVEEKHTNFKGHKMIAFSGGFIVNAHLPESIGIGRSSSRGFGTISKV